MLASLLSTLSLDISKRSDVIAPEEFFKLKHSPIVLLPNCQLDRIFGILGKKEILKNGNGRIAKN